MKKILMMLVGATIATATMAQAPLQTATYGHIDRHYIYSPELADTVTVDVLIPEGYDNNSSEAYPVLYMHDGQNLFDANTTWNHQAWEVDSVMGDLVNRGMIRPAIVVGVHSVAASRVGDLMPQKPIENIEGAQGDSLRNSFPGMVLRGDAYAAFMAKTLKDYVDSAYRTLPDAANTSVMGSSMGGIMSMYVICEYPEVFGNAGWVSSHWVGHEQGEGICSAALLNYLNEHTPDPATHRIYMDHGTEHSDAWYGPSDDKAIDILLDHGYILPNNLLYITDKRAGHMETYWARRLSLPLMFLLHR